MNYYTVKEGAIALGTSPKTVYDYVKEIEENTPHRFGRMFRGHYFLGNPRKEKVISDRDIFLLEQLHDFIEVDKIHKEEAVQIIFAAE